MDCPKSWSYAYQSNLSAKAQRDTSAMDAGSYAHGMLHIYYQLIAQGEAPGSEYALEFMLDRLREDFENSEHPLELMAKVAPLISHYVKARSPQIDKGIRVLGIEEELLYDTELVAPDGLPIFLHGFIDLVYQDSVGRIRVRDHKTGANPTSHSQAKTRMSHQLLTYGLAKSAQVVEISFVHSAPPKSGNSKRYELYTWMHTEKAYAFFLEQIKRTLTKMFNDEPSYHFSTNCSRCQFMPICSSELQGTAPEVIIPTLFKTKEPRVKLPIKVETDGTTSVDFQF